MRDGSGSDAVAVFPLAGVSVGASETDRFGFGSSQSEA